MNNPFDGEPRQMQWMDKGNRIKVLHVIRDLDEKSGGPPRSVQQTAFHLQKLGVDNSLLFYDRGCKLYLPHQGEEVIGVSAMNYLPQHASMNLAKKIRILFAKKRYNFVHINGMWSWLNHVVVTEAMRAKVPYIVSPRGMLEPWALKQKRIKKMVALFFYQRLDLLRATAIHCTARQEQNSVENLAIGAPTFVVPNGTCLPPFEIRNYSRSYQIERPRRMLFLSRIHPKKGVKLLIEAWSAIRPKGWECVICGPSEPAFLKSIASQIADAGLGDCFQLRDAIEGESKWRMYLSSDVFVLPSHSENFGLVVTEALACGVPVITTNKTPWLELEEHRCGWCVADTVEGIKIAMLDAISRPPQELSEMGERGRLLVDRKYTWGSVASQLLLKYHQYGLGSS